MIPTIEQGDILRWAETLQKNEVDVVFPEDKQLIAILCSTLCFTAIIGNVAMLNGRKLIGLVKAWIGVPEGAMDFDQCAKCWYIKIINEPTNAMLLFIFNTHSFQNKGELSFKNIVRLASSTFCYLLSSEYRMAITSCFISKLSLIGCTNLCSRFWGMCSPVHAVFASNMDLTLISVNTSSAKYLQDTRRRTSEQWSNLTTVFAILIHLYDLQFVGIGNFCSVLPCTLSRAIFPTTSFLVTFKR